MGRDGSGSIGLREASPRRPEPVLPYRDDAQRSRAGARARGELPAQVSHARAGRPSTEPLPGVVAARTEPRQAGPKIGSRCGFGEIGRVEFTLAGSDELEAAWVATRGIHLEKALRHVRT